MRFFLTACLIGLSFFSKSQNLDVVDVNGQSVAYASFYDTVFCSPHYWGNYHLGTFHAVNLSNDTMDVKVKRYENQYVPGSENGLYWFVSYQHMTCGSVYVFPEPGTPQDNHKVRVPPVDTSFVHSVLAVHGNGNCGDYCYTMVFYDGNNPNDSIWVNTCLHVATYYTDVDNTSPLKLSVYPTLASETVYFENKSGLVGNAYLIVTDINGKIHSRISTTNAVTELSVTDLSEGLYFYQYIIGSRIKSGKFIVQH